MGHVELSHVTHTLPDGRVLLSDVSFRVADGAKAALVGANGAGKTTLMRMVAGDLAPQVGGVVRTGGLGIMRQFIGQQTTGQQISGQQTGIQQSNRKQTGGQQTGSKQSSGEEPSGEQRSSQQGVVTVRDLLLSVAPDRVRLAAAEVEAAELAMMEADDEPTQMRYAHALANWADAGGYDFEVEWDVCCTEALGIPYDRAQWREITTLSGGEQKRLVLESLLRGPDEVLLLDEPDNYLDVPTKRWLEDKLRETSKTVLFVSHDRELLNRTATAIITVELGAAGNTIWTYGGGFANYHDARRDRFARLEELRVRWDEEHAKLKELVYMYRAKAAYNADMASRLQAAVTRLRRFEEAGPPIAVPREQNVTMRLKGGRTGKRAVICEDLALTGLTEAFDLEVWFGERIAILGANGSGKSHLLRLLAVGGSDPDVEHRPVGDVEIASVRHAGTARLGARVRPGWFAQTHLRPDLEGRTLVEILHRGDGQRNGMPREEASRVLDRYELAGSALQKYDTLSGGQQARFQILLLELGGATLLLLDEPTDNLDLASAEALEEGLVGFEGTVLAVTHDRWFARSFDRFIVLGSDSRVYESDDAVWDESRAVRP